MNNKEAIEILKQIPQRYFYGRRVNGKQMTYEALELAIKALEEQKRPTIIDKYADGYLQGYIDGSTGTDWRMIED